MNRARRCLTSVIGPTPMRQRRIRICINNEKAGTGSQILVQIRANCMGLSCFEPTVFKASHDVAAPPSD